MLRDPDLESARDGDESKMAIANAIEEPSEREYLNALLDHLVLTQAALSQRISQVTFLLVVLVAIEVFKLLR